MKVSVLQNFVHKDLGSFIMNTIVDVDDKIAKEFIKQNLVNEIEKKTRAKKVD